MLVAISGTPGVGKSTVSGELKLRRCEVVLLDELAEEKDLFEGEEDGCKLVNVAKLKRHVRKWKNGGQVFVVSHYSHLLGPDVAIVLRCSPRVLGQRLEERGWSAGKVRENMEAEAIDAITIQALDSCRRVYEVDSTIIKPKLVVDTILKILNDAKFAEGFKPGSIDYSEEVLDWY